MGLLKRAIRYAAIALGIVVSILLFTLASLYAMTWHSARQGEPMLVGEPTNRARPVVRRPGDATAEGSEQVLFGDLHVHTNYSADSFLQSYQIEGLDMRRTPADACDFARFCSQLDFWSINDHAESLTPAHWRATIEAVRACDAIAGDSEQPDLVSFLGWEWSHADRPERHYGHKNVVLADLADEAIPARPIASAPGFAWPFGGIGTLGVLMGERRYSDFASFHRYLFDATAVEDCPPDVPVRALPLDCRESAATPRDLFRKLDEWNHRALVIPHGLAWGTTNPAHARLDLQLEQHDPRWQRLLEVYSGHGNSERYVEFERPARDADKRYHCPSTGPGIELCCERAARLARARCDDVESAACEIAVDEAVQAAAGVDSSYGGLGSLTDAVAGTTPEDWGDCGQLESAFMPAWTYRPRQSAQYALALADVEGKRVDDRFRFGFVAASDTHRSRPGTGYKEFARLVMTDGVRYPLPADFFDPRHTAYYYSGGLTAVHATARDRDSIFDALSRKRVYGTSGARIVLHFDAIDDAGRRHPMGSEITARRGSRFRFEVRVLGARRQRPGCPDFVHAALSAERIASLCLGECHHPSDERHGIERVEVVRISPGPRGEAAIAARIEDPWRVFDCPADPAVGCRVEFDDPEGTAPERETAYYVRIVQEATPAINGDPLRCERDDSGRCIAVELCRAPPPGVAPDDCLAPVGERAWSSPIFFLPSSRS